MSTSSDVIVVGLGPTGLTLAAPLGRRGLSVLVLESQLGLAPAATASPDPDLWKGSHG